MRSSFLAMGSLLCAFLLGGCVRYQPVDVFVIGLTPIESAPFEQRIKVDLRIQNPNDTAIDATGMQIRLDANGARLARGVSDAAFTIPRLGETTTSIVATTSVFDLVKQLVVMSGKQTFQYVLEGNVYTTGGGPLARSVTFRNTGEFPPPTAPTSATVKPPGNPPVNQSGSGALQ
jgi:LEA14-like dessication related protein